jgi:peptidyl-prolyl cis-trans isomerase-like protein 2
LYDQVRKEKKKAYVKLLTNKGVFNIQLHSDMTPVTCDNFIQLCESKYFDNQSFHRLIPNFMIQGGDPTGTGRGGNSVFGSPFRDEFDSRLKHDSPGIVSMANSGKKNDNKSQFFITFAPCPHLDNKHTVFGKIVGGMTEFMRLNATATNSNDVPIDPIVIERAIVVSDPFSDVVRAKDEKQQQEAQDKKEAIYVQAARSDPMAQHINRHSMEIGKYIDWSCIEKKEMRIK